MAEPAAGRAGSGTSAPHAPINASFTHTPAPDPSQDLPPGNGPVMPATTVYYDFWLPTGQHFEPTAAGDTNYENLLSQWARDVGSSAFHNLVTQYSGTNGSISNTFTFGGSWVDTGTAYPHAGTTADPLQDADIQAEVRNATATNGWTEDVNHVVAVFTATGIQECDGSSCTFSSTNGFCAYHDHFTDNSNDTLYAFMGFDNFTHLAGKTCVAGQTGGDNDPNRGTYPNGDVSADAEINTLSHEVIESETDPHPNATWTGPNGEIGDACNFNFAPRNATGADVYLNGHPYILQQEWSNAVHTCAIDMCTVGGANSVCPPQVTGAETPDNPNPVIGTTVTYTVTVRNSDDTGAATNLTVNGPLPNGYVLTGLQAPGAASSSSTSSSFTVAYDTLPVHQSQAITVTATVPVQVGQSATACATISLQDLLGTAQPAVATSPCATTTPGKIPTTTVYTGPTTADYHDAFTASATVTGGGPVSGGPVTFTLGGASCTATTDASGIASCPLTPVDAAGPTTLSAAFAGDATHLASSTAVGFTITREETTLAYTGPAHVANGVPATLSGVLKEDGSVPIAGRSVLIAMGAGASQQTCTGTTDATGTATCTIPLVNQPLNAAATVPVALSFGGDAFYLPSAASATVRLEYYTGRSYGLSADINLLLTQLVIRPTPDTGPVRVAQATTTTTPCTVSLNTLLISAGTLCANVTTRLAPGTSTATATVQNATIGLPGLPVIGISGLTARSVSSCAGTSASTTLTLTIAGVRITVPTAPNSVISLAGGARLVINEQSPVPGADFGTTVNAVHLTLPGILGLAATDVVVGSATSDAHNCT